MSAHIDSIFYAIPAIALLAVARMGRGVHWRQVLGVAALMTPLSLLLVDSFLRAPRVRGFVLWPLPAPYFVLDLVLWFLVWCGAAFFWVPRPARPSLN